MIFARFGNEPHDSAEPLEFTRGFVVSCDSLRRTAAGCCTGFCTAYARRCQGLPEVVFSRLQIVPHRDIRGVSQPSRYPLVVDMIQAWAAYACLPSRFACRGTRRDNCRWLWGTYLACLARWNRAPRVVFVVVRKLAPRNRNRFETLRQCFADDSAILLQFFGLESASLIAPLVGLLLGAHRGGTLFAFHRL